MATLRLSQVLAQTAHKNNPLIKRTWCNRKLAMYMNDKNIKSEFQVIDLRSDTVTKPTPQMRKAIFEAIVGDDVYGEDPTVNALEKKAAELLGKDAALFVPTGTMGNLIAVMVHCSQRGSEMIVGDQSHMFKYEQGGASQIAGVHVCTVKNKADGTFDLTDLQSHIRGNDIHEPRTALVCVENTHNMCGGKVIPLEWLTKLADIAKSHSIPLHMDGARLFNAAVYLKIPASRIVQDFASISFCLSKGLGSPVGSLLVGDQDFISRARRMRKALGGGMRQAGVIAAAGLFSLNNMIDRLVEDHKHAFLIAKAIAEFKSKYVNVDIKNLHTNILLIDLLTPLCAEDFCQRLSLVTEEENQKLKRKVIIKTYPKTNRCVRFVTHEGIGYDDTEAIIYKLQYVLQEYENVSLCATKNCHA